MCKLAKVLTEFRLTEFVTFYYVSRRSPFYATTKRTHTPAHKYLRLFVAVCGCVCVPFFVKQLSRAQNVELSGMQTAIVYNLYGFGPAGALQ